MALQLGFLRTALVEAGASDESASKAAEEAAGYENRLANVESDLRTLKWMVGTNVALTVAVLFKLFH